jgi:hypothetical protein
MASHTHTRRGKFRDDGGVSPRDTKVSSPSSPSDDSGTLQGDSSPIATRVTSLDMESASRKDSPNNDIASITESRFFGTDRPFFDDNSDKRSPRNVDVRPNGSEKSLPNIPTEPARYKAVRTTSTPYHSGGNGFRNSRTWVSPDTQYQHDFAFVRNAMRRLFKHSDVAKWRLTDYIAHREAMLESQKKRLSKCVSQKEHELELGVRHIEPKAFHTFNELLPGHNLSMEGNKSRVLGQKTIWCHEWMNGKDDFAPWPTMAEMKWEGDDRAKTGVGRFPPIPREVGAPGIAWNQLQAVEVYPIDQVWRIPQLDDILLPVDEIDEETKPNLLNSDLEIAMDEYLET